MVGTLKDVGYKHGRWLDSVLMQRALGPGRRPAAADALIDARQATSFSRRSRTRSTLREVVAALEDQAGRRDQRLGALAAGEPAAA